MAQHRCSACSRSQTKAPCFGWLDQSSQLFERHSECSFHLCLRRYIWAVSKPYWRRASSALWGSNGCSTLCRFFYSDVLRKYCPCLLRRSTPNQNLIAKVQAWFANWEWLVSLNRFLVHANSPSQLLFQATPLSLDLPWTLFLWRRCYENRDPR